MTAATVRAMLEVADGVIVGTAFKPALSAPVEVARVRELLDIARG